MSGLNSLQPSVTSMVDTEQTVSRTFDVDASSGDYDMEISYRGGMFRPSRVTLHYRVNKGATTPYWYLFQVRVKMAKVLKNDRVSDAYQNIRTESVYPEHAPTWLREMGAALLPQTLPER